MLLPTSMATEKARAKAAFRMPSSCSFHAKAHGAKGRAGGGAAQHQGHCRYGQQIEDNQQIAHIIQKPLEKRRGWE